MRLLVFSDLHVSKNHCKRIVEMAEDVDILVGAGDFGRLRMGIKKTIGWLKKIDKPSMLVPGNSESYDELKKACSTWPTATVLHGTGVTVNGIAFFGIGGGIPVTPFGSWSWDFTEDQAKALLEKCPAAAVLIAHSPPKGILDLSSRGQHLGSAAIFLAIKEKIPRLVVCGHIHESGGKRQWIGETEVVNAGPEGMLINLIDS